MKKALLIIFLLIIVLGGGYFVYTKFINKNSPIGSGVLNKATLNPNCKHNDPDLCRFLNNWKDTGSYTYNSTDTSEGKTTTSVLKIEGDDKSQMTMSQDGKESFNVITIGDTNYTKDYTDNKWWKEVTKPSDSTIQTEIKEDLDLEEADDNTTYKKIGTEACEKLTCFKYQVIDPALTDTTQFIYFDNKEYRLRKMRTESKEGVSEATIDYSKVSIKEPSPIKEGSPLQGTIPELPAELEIETE